MEDLSARAPDGTCEMSMMTDPKGRDVRPWPGDNDHEGAQAFAPTNPDGDTSSDPLDDIKSGLKAWFSLGLSIGDSLDAQTKSWSALMARLQHFTPVDYGTGASQVYPATGLGLLIFGAA